MDRYFSEKLKKHLDKDFKFCPDNLMEDRRVHLFICAEITMSLVYNNPELDRVLDILSHSLSHTIDNFKEQYDFFEPQLVIRMDSNVGFILPMKEKEDENV